MRAAALLALLGSLAAPACSQIIGIEDVTLGDGAPPNTVIGRSFTRHLTAAGTMDVPADLSQAVIQALIVDPAEVSGYLVSNGEGRADGTFTIPDVPDGLPFLLKVNTSYYATERHNLELRLESPTRGVPPPAALTGPAILSFDVRGMTPVVNGPEDTFTFVELHSLSVGYFGAMNPPAHNARALTQSFDWSNGFALTAAKPLPDAAHGDDLTLLHLRDELVLGTMGRRQRVSRVVDTFTTTGITVASGATATVGGTWTPAGASNRSVNLMVTRGAYDAGYDNTTYSAGMTVTLMAHPVAAVSLAPPVFRAQFNDFTRGVLSETLGFTYPDPFPASWSRATAIYYTGVRWALVPGTTASMGLGMINSSIAPYTGGNPSTAPVIQPPANFRVAGKDAGGGGLVSFDGKAPVELTWSAVATAELYTVRVDRLFANGSFPRSERAASLTTPQTSIKIPAEVFAGGEIYAFFVDAVRAPSDYGAGELIPNGIPLGNAGVASNLFRLSARCGNNVLDPGEDCDTGGESATCDVDCTTPMCGDGYRNIRAAEICDTALGTGSCDPDCTLPVCGDSYINSQVEDCDDGNTTDSGNGCSSTCRFNNLCGNGTVQDLVEECDPGAVGQDTATCDRDCTTRFCGDGHRNAAANEQCDDRNTDNGDGCSSTCQNE